MWVDPRRQALIEAEIRELVLFFQRAKHRLLLRRLEWEKSSRGKPHYPMTRYHRPLCSNRRDRLCVPRTLRRGYVGYIKERSKRR